MRRQFVLASVDLTGMRVTAPAPPNAQHPPAGAMGRVAATDAVAATGRAGVALVAAAVLAVSA